MSLDSKISILLSELKNSPKIQSTGTNNINLQESSVLTEPLFSGIKDNIPVLLGKPFLLNSPNIFDVRLELFILLKEQIVSNLSLIDIISISQDKAFKEIIESRELLTTFLSTEIARETVEIDQLLQFLKAFKISENLEFDEHNVFSIKKSIVSALKSIEVISKKVFASKEETVELLSNLNNLAINKDTKDLLNTTIFRLVSRAENAVDRVGVRDIPPRFSKKQNPNELVVLNALYKELEQTKSFVEIIKTRSSPLVAKARIIRETVLSFSRTELNTSLNKEENVLTKDTRLSKDVKHSTFSTFSSRTMDLISRALISVDRLNTKSSNQLFTKKPIKDLVLLSISRFFKVNRELLEKFTIRDAIINPAKVRLEIEKLGTLSKEAKEIEKPIRELADLISRVVLEPTKVTEDEITLLTAILTPKAKYAKDSVSITELITIGVPFRLQEVFDVNAVRLAKFLSMQIVYPEKVDTRDQVIASRALEIQKSSLGVKSSDRDSSGIGDVSFLFSTRILEFALLVARIVNIHVEKPLHSKISIRDSFVAPLSQVVSSRTSINDIKFGSLVGKNVVNLLVNLEDLFLIKDIKKQPILEKLTLKSFILNPAFAEHITERFLANDTFNPYLLRKSNDFKVDVRDRILKRFQEKNDGIQDTVSTSIKGYAFIRDTDYVKGAYFLQPYVATIPPGNSRQF
tara:strand:- start:2855 stop:4921 length:2067 start_codon:yes stop_codon:yes gene_type:complete